MTQRERNAIIHYQRDAFETYLKVCIKLDETPKPDIVTLIGGCQNIQALKETIVLFENRLR